MSVTSVRFARRETTPTTTRLNDQKGPRSSATKHHTVIGLISAFSVSITFGGAAVGADPNPPTAQAAAPQISVEELYKNLHCMEQRIQYLEAQARGQSPGSSDTNASSLTVERNATGPSGESPDTQSPNTSAKTAAPSVDSEQHGAAANAPNTIPPACASLSAAATKPDSKGKKDLFALSPSQAPTANRDLFALPPANTSTATTGNKDIFGLVSSPVDGLKLGSYGEIKYGSRQNPAANGQWQNGFDPSRLVLLPTYAITDNIIFNAEIEFEHAGSAFDADDKEHGTAEIEQMWIDFKIVDWFNFRSPGLDLVPLGYTNLHHEPTLFYSVDRPELANGLIPTTFAVPSSSIYGQIVEGLNYQFQVSSSLEDFGDDFGLRTAANTVPPFPHGYAPGITGLDALAFAQPARGDFRQLNNDLAYATQLTYAPTFWPGFAGSTGIYFTPNTTPRGAYADTGALLGKSSLVLLDSEFRYRVPDSGFEFRGEYAQAWFGNPANLRANNDTDPTDNVGKTMYGYSGEIDYHYALGKILNSDWEAVPFYRYTLENLQASGFAGTDLNAPTGAGQLQFHTAGIAVFPSPKVVMKLDYQKIINREVDGARSDSVLGGFGYFF